MNKENIIEKINNKVQTDKKLELNNANPILTRYMPLKTFIKCLRSDSLRVSRPKTWKSSYDVFEDLLSSVSYKKMNEICSSENLTKDYYAQCWNIGDECEGMWKSHTQGLDNGVMIKIKLENLIKMYIFSLSNEIDSDRNFKFLKVKYVKTEEIVGQAENYLKDVFDKGCNASNYIDFFKLKRIEFEYEKEYRFLIELSKNNDIDKDNRYIKDFISNIEEVVFSPKFDYANYLWYKEKLVKDYEITEGKISKSTMFDLSHHLKNSSLSIEE